MKDPRVKTMVIAIGGNAIVFGVCTICRSIWDVDLVPVMVISLLLTVMTIVLANVLGKKSGGNLGELERVMAAINTDGHSEASARELLAVYRNGWEGRNKLVVGAACADELDNAGLVREASEVVGEILPLTKKYNKSGEDRSYCAMAWLVSFSCAVKRMDKQAAAQSFERYSGFVKESLDDAQAEEEYKSVCAEYEALCGDPAKAESIYLSKQSLSFSDLVGLTRLYSASGSTEKAKRSLEAAASTASNENERLTVKALETEIKLQ